MIQANGCNPIGEIKTLVALRIQNWPMYMVVK